MSQGNNKLFKLFSLMRLSVGRFVAAGIFAAFVFAPASGDSVYAQQPEKPIIVPFGGETELLVGKAIERESSGKPADQNHHYLVRLKAGQFFQIKVERDKRFRMLSTFGCRIRMPNN